MVLSPKGEDKYEMKYVPEDFDRYDQGFFGRAKPEYIIVKGECLEKLKQQGYEMDCWQKGIPLAIIPYAQYFLDNSLLTILDKKLGFCA